MSRRRHTPDQAIRKLRDGEKFLNDGRNIDEVCKPLEVSAPTFHRWQAQFGGLKADDAKRLKDLDKENQRLKKTRRESGTRYRHAQGAEPGKLVSPDRKRTAVQVLRQRFGCSERRACLLVGKSRTTQRRGPAQIADTERVLRARLREISAQRPRWGWRKAHAIARSEGLVTNRKRTRRLWRDEGLKRPATARKKRRIGEGRNQRLTAERPDQMWALGFQTDATIDGRQVRFVNVIDEFTREALATRPFRSCTSDQLCSVLDDVVAVTKRRPEHIRMDNGTEMTAHAMADWCRFTGVDAAFIDPGSPWQNGRCESVGGRFRDEFLKCEEFGSMLEVAALAEDWRIDGGTSRLRGNNSHRPHGSLGFCTPEAFRAGWLAKESENQPRLS